MTCKLTVGGPEWDKESPASPEEDMVNQPNHYNLSEDWSGRLDAMHVIRIVLGEDGWKAYCKGNMLKYLLRSKWDGDEDIAKAGRYAEMYRDEESI